MLTALAVLVIGLFAAAAARDLACRRIPNTIVLALALAALLRFMLETEAAPGADLLAGIAVFVTGAALFNFSLLGGGDVKLLAAGALWLGASATLSYLMITALVGGGLAIIYLVRQYLSPRRGQGAPVLPYGVAIAAGGIAGTLGTL